METPRRLRVLHAGEFSALSTGYGTYARNVQQRLHDSGKYEVAELAAYYDAADAGCVAEASRLPWKVYPNIPADPGRRASYDGNAPHQFGEFSFNDVLLDFRPDVVWTIRDKWMDDFVERSPFRRFFRWLHMPTVDAAPQPEHWLATYASADACFAYSDWGADVLRSEGGGLIRVLGSAPAGADTDVFAPMEKGPLRAHFGIPEDALVVGTVMRNNPRKLYPELIRAFARYLELAGPLASRSYLYLHASYPEPSGWDIPRLVKRSGVSRKILLTYKCYNCKEVRASRYCDARAFCPSCNTFSAGLPNARNGVSTRELAAVINLFDAYAQYSNSEGLGLPQIEAAACGVPVFSTDYSAMSDVVRKVNGHPVKVASLTEDVEFGCLRALPCPEDFAAALLHLFSLPEAERRERRYAARRGVLEHYQWPQTAARWMAAFDGLPPAEPWDAPRRTFTPTPLPAADFPGNEAMVRWCLEHRLGRPDLVGTHAENALVRDVNWNSRGVGRSFEAFGPEKMLAEMDASREAANAWERRRRPDES